MSHAKASTNYAEIISEVINKENKIRLILKTFGIKRAFLTQLRKDYSFRLYPVFFSEDFNLSKRVVWCRNSKLKYSMAMSIFDSVMNLFRGDIETSSFVTVLFTDSQSKDGLNEVINYLNDLGLAECEVFNVRKTVKLTREPSCFDFEKGTWVCGEVLNTYGRDASVISNSFDVKDVILSNHIYQGENIRKLIHHLPHILPTIQGFTYTLKSNDYIVDVIGEEPLDTFPNTVWYLKLDRRYLTEIHLSKEELYKFSHLCKRDSIISIRSESFSKAKPLPVEFFKEGIWKFPTIKVVYQEM
ncbi:hypothetical protein HS7_11880 [Sulfolobales archaeon HS-7]|nr:hypothetical protein HS7_11880 [Sulfolobales archaeon HS-7]